MKDDNVTFVKMMKETFLFRSDRLKAELNFKGLTSNATQADWCMSFHHLYANITLTRFMIQVANAAFS